MGPAVVRNGEPGRMESNQMVSREIRTAPLISPFSILRYWGPVCMYAGLIFFGSSVSHPPESVSSLVEKISDKILHLCEYGVLGALAYRACRHGAGARVARHAVIVAVAGCALYGLSDEIHQLFVPLRQGRSVGSGGRYRGCHARGLDLASHGAARRPVTPVASTRRARSCPIDSCRGVSPILAPFPA
jgi:VanZ family protein